MTPTLRPLLIVVEGINDIEFLLRLSRRLTHSGTDIPDLPSLVSAGRIVFLPFGGGSPAVWTNRLAPLECREIHLYDREIPPESKVRVEAMLQVNARPGCRAFVTCKRSLESYLHPTAIESAGGGQLSFNEIDCVGMVIARRWHESVPRSRYWDDLPLRKRRQFIYRAKRWLNTVAVEHMSADLLAEQDPDGEVLGWFRAIRHEIDSTISTVCDELLFSPESH